MAFASLCSCRETVFIWLPVVSLVDVPVSCLLGEWGRNVEGGGGSRLKWIVHYPVTLPCALQCLMVTVGVSSNNAHDLC